MQKQKTSAKKAQSTKAVTSSYTTKFTNVTLTAKGEKFNNFNVINNKNKTASVAHLNKYKKLAIKQSYIKFFNTVDKAVNMQANLNASSYVNYKFTSKNNVKVNLQFWTSANTYLLCAQVKVNLLNKLQKYVIASNIFNATNVLDIKHNMLYVRKLNVSNTAQVIKYIQLLQQF